MWCTSCEGEPGHKALSRNFACETQVGIGKCGKSWQTVRTPLLRLLTKSCRAAGPCWNRTTFFTSGGDLHEIHWEGSSAPVGGCLDGGGSDSFSLSPFIACSLNLSPNSSHIPLTSLRLLG